jgi:hypothetical protein
MHADDRRLRRHRAAHGRMRYRRARRIRVGLRAHLARHHVPDYSQHRARTQAHRRALALSSGGRGRGRRGLHRAPFRDGPLLRPARRAAHEHARHTGAPGIARRAPRHTLLSSRGSLPKSAAHTLSPARKLRGHSLVRSTARRALTCATSPKCVRSKRARATSLTQLVESLELERRMRPRKVLGRRGRGRRRRWRRRFEQTLARLEESG